MPIQMPTRAELSNKNHFDYDSLISCGYCMLINGCKLFIAAKGFQSNTAIIATQHMILNLRRKELIMECSFVYKNCFRRRHFHKNIYQNSHTIIRDLSMIKRFEHTRTEQIEIETPVNISEEHSRIELIMQPRVHKLNGKFNATEKKLQPFFGSCRLVHVFV